VPQLAAGAALFFAVLVGIVMLLFGGGDPTLREQYGGHGGTPNVKTGNTGRIALDGRWTVANDPQATGTGKDFQAGKFEGKAVRLPYVPNADSVSERSFNGSVAWYKTTFTVPDDGRYALRFESVNHKAQVFLDGEEIAAHTGVYLPFEVKRKFKKDAKHTLVVRADWRNPDQMKAAGWHRAWFNWGGINREVTLRPVAGKEVHGVRFRTRLASGGAATVTVRASNATSGTLGKTKLKFKDGRATATIKRAKLWSPFSPTLQTLTLKAGKRTSWRGKVGLREIRRDGATLLFNGKPLKLRGASLHEDARGRGDGLTPSDERALVNELKDLGANATRAQHPLSPALMEQLDAAGILVWMGVGPVDAPGAWTSRGPKLVQQAKDRVRASLEQLQTHPSLLAWNLANEVAGQGHPAGQAPYIDAMARELKQKDPGRLVALDIWGAHPPKFAGPMYEHIDAVGWTNYLGWYEQPYSTPEQLEQLIRTKLTQFQQVFPGKVLVVTEFGAEGSTKNPTNDPGGYAFQAKLLRTHIRTYATSPGVTGMLVWNLRDFGVAPSFGGGSIVEVVDDITLTPGLNEKGLRRWGGEPKPAAEAVKQEYAKLR
jgi:beta-galactosidase/beta-glucuronidase